MNKQILLASRPDGWVSPDNFKLVESAMPVCGDGQVMVRNHFLSLDPYMRGRMEETKSYAAAQELNQVMVGGTVGEVMESHNPKFKVGDKVVGFYGWQQYGVSSGAELMKVDTTHVPLSAYLGPVGMPGVTAWYGVNQICKPQAGQTLVVSAASGAVGSVVGQLAKMAGAHAVGIAGGQAKCDYVVNELGFDACVDYKAAADSKMLYKMLKDVTPNGVDCVFENVGGMCLDVTLARMNPFGRIALCGLIAGYNGQDIAMQNARVLLTMRLLVQGFIVSEHMDIWPQALKELGMGVGSKKIKYRETIAQGIEAAPAAFIGLLKGENFGKQLVSLV